MLVSYSHHLDCLLPRDVFFSGKKRKMEELIHSTKGGRALVGVVNWTKIPSVKSTNLNYKCQQTIGWDDKFLVAH